jgi:hypothetical protein
MPCLSGKNSLKVEMSMEHWRSDILVVGTRSEFPDSNLSQCHLVHHKSDMDWPGIEPGLSR